LGYISRSKWCLSTCSKISFTSEISPILHSKPVLSIQSPLFRTNFSTESLHKNSSCSGSIPEVSRQKDYCSKFKQFNSWCCSRQSDPNSIS
jgi:hypothetical protein